MSDKGFLILVEIFDSPRQEAGQMSWLLDEGEGGEKTESDSYEDCVGEFSGAALDHGSVVVLEEDDGGDESDDETHRRENHHQNTFRHVPLQALNGDAIVFLKTIINLILILIRFHY